MKTLQECKDEVARKYGYNDWKSTDFYQIDTMNETKPGEVDAEHFLLDQAAELYARAKWDEACEAQRKLCYRAYMDQPVIEGKDKSEGISKEMEAIINASRPEFKP